MSTTLLTTVDTQEGEVTVMTKDKYLFVFSIPRTSILPSRAAELGRSGIQLQWSTSEPRLLERLHNLVIQALREVSLTELRAIADYGKQFLSLGLPFIPPDAPLPECLKEISSYVKRAI